MKCHDCTARSAVYAGRTKKAGVRIRYRRCPNGHRQVTWEIPKALWQATQNELKGLRSLYQALQKEMPKLGK